jgi:enoyl-CoA hydratase/carnithine racemase
VNFKTIEYRVEDFICWVKLNDPQRRNAISLEMVDELTTCLRHFDRDPKVRLFVLSGQGRAFSAGGNVKDMLDKKGMFEGEPFELRRRYELGIQQIPKTIEALDKPIIAMVNGAAIGAGCDLAFMCDMRILCEHSKFGETFSKLGLLPGVGGTYFLTRAVGYSKAMQMFLTGDIISGEEAYKMGLGNYFTTSENLELLTKKVADKVVANAPEAIVLTKRILKSALRRELDDQLNILAAYQSMAQRMDDHFEGVNALLEKRSPEFKGE